MTANRVGAGRGWDWIVEGWRLFTQAPGLWIVMLLIYLVINIVLSFIPLVGPVASTLITPALIGGMLYGADVLARGQALAVPHLFQAFQDQQRLGPMLTLGALLLGACVLLVLVAGGIIVGGALSSGVLNGGLNDDQMVALMAGSGLIVLLFVLVVGLAIAMALFYAIPLVMLAGQAPWSAVKDSFSAGLNNFLPLLVFGLIYLGLSVLAVSPLGLGFLVLLPVTFGAVYASYRDVFSDPRTAGPGAPSLAKR
jgi:uncharacterized membrane protein